jgi:MFS family permease
MSSLAKVLKSRDYQLLWSIGALASAIEVSELLVMGWLVLQLGGSAWQVALLGFTRTAPMFALSLIAGDLADRIDKRRILAAANLLNGLVVSAVLAVVALGVLEPWHLFLAAGLKGATRPFEQTSRRIMIFDVVGPSGTVISLSLENVSFSVGRIVGPLIAGALLEINRDAVGVFSFLLALQVVALVAIALVKIAAAPRARSRTPVWESILEGLKYSGSNPVVAALLAASVVMNVIFRYPLLIPVVAEESLHVGPGQMGLLASADGMGTVAGSVAFATRGTTRNHGRIFLAGSMVCCAFLLAFALSSSYLLSFAMLLGLGVAQVGFSTMQGSILLLGTVPSMHGRVIGTQALAAGTGHLTSLEMGWLASAFGVSAALAYNAVTGLVLLLVIAVFMPSLRRPMEYPTRPSPESRPGG